MAVFAQQTSDTKGEVISAIDQLKSSVNNPLGIRDGSDATDPMGQQREQAEMVKAWLPSNAWRELSLQDQMWLFDSLRGPDLVSKHEFSARWTGTVRVPTSGSYTFIQYRIPGSEGMMRLWVDGVIVLDSFPKEDRVIKFAQNGEEIEEDSRFQSTAVSLTAGQSYSFRLDYARTPRQDIPGTMRLPGFPMAVLQWESETLEQQVIPETAFFPPDNSAFRGQTGLQSEYFSDSTHTQRVTLRRDPAVDFIWDIGMVAAENHEAQGEIVAANAARLCSPTFFASLDKNESEEFVKHHLPSLFRSMTATQRVAVMVSLTEQPDMLQYISFAQMAAALRWLSLRSENDTAINLLVQWSEQTPPPRTVPAFFPGRGAGGYLETNIEPYFRLSRLFTQGNVMENIDALARHLTKPDGSCNLTIAYVLCCACRMTGNGGQMMNLIEGPVHDDHIVGDVKMTWYLAEAFASESLFGHDFQPGYGMIHVQEAFEAAETLEAKFWAFQELIARLLSSERLDIGKTLVENSRNQFPGEEKQTMIDEWIRIGESIAERHRQARETNPEPDRQAFIEELTRRAETAEQHGDTSTVERYQQIISDYNKEKERKEAEKRNTIQ